VEQRTEWELRRRLYRALQMRGQVEEKEQKRELAKRRRGSKKVQQKVTYSQCRYCLRSTS
jgi:hypothetical protein